MTTTRIADVPPYLRDGSFYLSLDPDDKDTFEVPEFCVKSDTTVESSEDLKSLLMTVRFWGLKDIPIEVIQYIFCHGAAQEVEEFLVEYPELGKILQVKEAPSPNAINTAIKLKLGVGVIRMLHQINYPIDMTACEGAAAVGDLETLMFLHSEGFLWDERTPKAAVDHHHSDCLRLHWSKVARCTVICCMWQLTPEVSMF